MMHRFAGSLLFTAVALALAALYGWFDTGSLVATAGVIWVVLVLAVLEVSLSFDNAVVNAAALGQMDAVWQRRFLTWGMAIAVFGMRVVFPLAIVALAAGVGPIDATVLALTEPARYEMLVSGAHGAIAGFGGAFLLLVGLDYFLDPDKTVHWIGWVERRLAALALVRTGGIALVLVLLLAIARQLPGPAALVFVEAGLAGIIAHIAVEAIGTVLEAREAARRVAGTLVRSGLGGFLYLNVLDASFSFDGVIGAFALSNNMVIIALGLSIGAMFVRSITLALVREGTLAQYRYLEHGAFWAIVALGVIMLVSARHAVPETVTGLIGAVLIGLSLWASRQRS
ncbi:hypothetical protein AQZ49_10590 [Novosphingobium sp. FSW06-99]|nr:DUF475 domain-containing protein [Novosphingobium sp. FSW06-99]KUR77226.1 hypothetical protein AQZ49_10590 [Novosphingobium sp. FSW06-99]